MGFTRIPAVLAATSLAFPAVAQDAGDDWDVQQFRDGGVTQAVLAYADAPTLIARCAAGYLVVAVADLPGPAIRDPELTLEHRDLRLTRWQAADGGFQTFVQSWVLRDLMVGGEIALTVGNSDAARRYRLQAPADSRAVAGVLTACGAALSSPRDAAIIARRRAARAVPAEETPAAQPDAVQWRRRPLPRYPDTAINRGIDRGMVSLNCEVTADGRLADCFIDTEFPVGFGFGAEVLRSTRDARLKLPDGTPPDDSRIVFSLYLQTD